MIPGSFDPATAREVVGDSVARAIEDKARRDADAGRFDGPVVDGWSYWDRARKEMHVVVYRAQFEKRTARNARKLGVSAVHQPAI